MVKEMRIIKATGIIGVEYWVRHYLKWYWVTRDGYWVRAVPPKNKKEVI